MTTPPEPNIPADVAAQIKAATADRNANAKIEADSETVDTDLHNAEATEATQAATIATDTTALAADQATIGSDTTTIAADQAVIAADNTTIATDTATIAADTAEIAALQAKLGPTGPVGGTGPTGGTGGPTGGTGGPTGPVGPPPTSGPPVFPAIPVPETLPPGLGHVPIPNAGTYANLCTPNLDFANLIPAGQPFTVVTNGFAENAGTGAQPITNATTWACTNIAGNRWAGTINGSTFTIPPPAGLASWPNGFYSVTTFNAAGVQVGDAQFHIWNDNVPNLPTFAELPNGTTDLINPTGATFDPYANPVWPMAAACGLLATRLSINNADDLTDTRNSPGYPQDASAQNADDVLGDEAYEVYDAQWWRKWGTPQRPHVPFTEFPNGTAQPVDCVAQKLAGSTGTASTGLGVLVTSTTAIWVQSPTAGTLTVSLTQGGPVVETFSGNTWGALSASINEGNASTSASEYIYSWTDSPGSGATGFASIEVPSTYFAGVVTAVQDLTASVNPIDVFEGPYNEPLNTVNSTIAQTVCFVRAVHQGNPAAKAMGPMPVSDDGGLINWFQQVLTGLKNAGTMVDYISTHGYNSVNGDLVMGDHTLSELTSMFASLGLAHVPVWMTETGEFYNNFGSMNWRSATHWTALRTLLYEAYGIPVERQCYFYMSSHGFDGFPSYLNGGGVRPGPAFSFFRGLAERTSDATFSERLAMPGPAQRMVFGSVYSSARATTVVLMCAGPVSATVDLNIGSAASTVYDWAGNVTGTNPGGAGTALPVVVSDLPTYVVLPPNTPVTVVDVDNGLAACTTDLALSATVHSSSSSAQYGAVAQINNGLFEDGYYFGDGGQIGERPFRDAVAPPAWVGLSWSTPQTIQRVILTAPVPWQTQTAPLSFTVSTWNGSAWIAQYGFTSATSKSNPFGSGNPWWKATQENYWDSQSTWDIILPEKISTEAVLITVTQTSWGDAPDLGAAEASYNYQWPPALCLREVEVY